MIGTMASSAGISRPFRLASMSRFNQRTGRRPRAPPARVLGHHPIGRMAEHARAHYGRLMTSTPPPDAGRFPGLIDELDDLALRYGNRFLLEPAPDQRLPEYGMSSSTRCA